MLVFISYSRVDKDLVSGFEKNLTANKINCFLDEKDIEIGENVNDKIDRSLNRATHIIAIISPASIKSNWVAYEIGLAKGKQIKILSFLTHRSIELPSFMSHLNYRTNIDEVLSYLNREKEKEEKYPPDEIEIKFTGWSTWGGVEAIVEDKKSNEVFFSGNIESAAGYVIEGNLPYGGNILILKVIGSKRSRFSKHKLFKLEANDKALSPIERNKINLDDSHYIDAEDGTISYPLPEELSKLQIVFWKANLNNLFISAQLQDKT